MLERKHMIRAGNGQEILSPAPICCIPVSCAASSEISSRLLLVTRGHGAGGSDSAVPWWGLHPWVCMTTVMANEKRTKGNAWVEACRLEKALRNCTLGKKKLQGEQCHIEQGCLGVRGSLVSKAGHSYVLQMP